MKKKMIIILISVLVLSLTLVGIVSAYQGSTFLADISAETEEEDNEALICSGEAIHPVLESLAEDYEGVEYEDLLFYFCEQDFGVGEIEHALTTAALVDDEAITYEMLLAKVYEDGMAWGEIWQELGLIGSGDGDEGDGEGDGDGKISSHYCSVDSEAELPALADLAEQYGVEYSELLTFFCEGYGLGEIKLALKTAEKMEDEDLWNDFLILPKKDRDGGWGKLWQMLGLIGKDKMKGDQEDYKAKPEDHPGQGKGLDKKP